MLPLPPALHPPEPKRGRIDRIGTRVLDEMVEMIVTGSIAAGAGFPSEHTLCEEFGVSRTVVRECIKRLQEKGLVLVTRGRGTLVRDPIEWNVLDPDVFDALVRHDVSLGVLDEVSVLRGAREGVMAAEVASTASPELLRELDLILDAMRSAADSSAFLEADTRFHLALMSASQNRIAATIARAFFVRPRLSSRWDGDNPADAAVLTVQEHERILAALHASDAPAARAAMEGHILDSWRRRRLPDGEHHLSPVTRAVAENDEAPRGYPIESTRRGPHTGRRADPSAGGFRRPSPDPRSTRARSTSGPLLRCTWRAAGGRCCRCVRRWWPDTGSRTSP